jgi:hypothetical protein
MATRTSTQSGNFNSTTTWGGNPVPVDGDSFIVSAGHIVTIDDDRRTTNGFGDSDVDGKLHITGTGKIRLNGILYIDNVGNFTTYFTEGNASSAGFLRMDPGALCEIKGTLADQHSIRMVAKSHTTLEIIGNNPNPQTTITADANSNETSLTFNDASNFAIGDWITVYKAERAGKNYTYYKTDESMWIHDIDYLNDTVYFRQFVSPETTILSIDGTDISVIDASVMRVGYQIIFGTDTNRNIKTITAINYATNTITINSAITGSVIGEKIYRTGLSKAHFDGDDVLRISAVLTEDSDAGTNTIVVNNTNGFSVGDLILIGANDPVYSNGTSWDVIMDYTISEIDTNTNTITITGGFSSPTQTTLQKNVKAGVGGLVVNMTRDTKITAPAGTTYGTNNVGFVTWDYQTSNQYYRRIKIKNTEFSCGSSNASAYYASFGGRGHQSFDLTSYGQYTFEINGNSVYPTYRAAYAIGYIWDAHQCNIRNNVVYNSGSGWSLSRYGNNTGLYSNIVARTVSGIYTEGHYEPYTETAYNYAIRCNTGYSFNQLYEPKASISSNYAIFLSDIPLGGGYVNGIPLFRKFYIDYFVRWPAMDRHTILRFSNSYFGNAWDITDYNPSISRIDKLDLADMGQSRTDRTSSLLCMCIVNGYNFKYNQSVIFNRSALRIYDNYEKAWRVYPDQNDSGWKGFVNDVYVPANSQVFIKGTVKTHPGNTNYPYIYITGDTDGYSAGKTLTINDGVLDPLSNIAFITEFTGFRHFEQFTNSVADYETKTITMPALPFDYYLSISISSNGSSGNAGYGWWEKDLEISLDNQYGGIIPYNLLHFNTTRTNVIQKLSANQMKTILGG